MSLVVVVFIISMGSDYISELWPPAGLLFIPQVIYEYGVPWWNGIDGKTEELGKNLSQCHCVHYKSRMDCPGCKPGPPR
jgi:hypothetical protein